MNLSLAKFGLLVLLAGVVASGCDDCSGTIKGRPDYIGELTVEPAQVDADGQATAQVTVRVLRNEAGNPPAAGVEVVLHSSRNQPGDEVDTIEQPEGPTDAEGIALAQVSSLTLGGAGLSATVDGSPLCERYDGGECVPAVVLLTFVCPASVDCCEDADCDDGLFCNGVETCVDRTCQAGTDPCPGEACDEDQDSCGGCLTDANCDDGVDCTVDTCNTADHTCQNVPDHGACAAGETCDPVQGCITVPCQDDSDCDDGLFCNGAETCDNGSCAGGTMVDCGDGVDCTVDSCNEDTDGCDNPPDDGLCDDGAFCNGAETCDAVNGCTAGADPCAAGGQNCDEVNDVCYSCGDGVLHDSEDCDPGAPLSHNCCDATDCTFVASGGADPQGVCSGAPECQEDVCDGSGGCTTANLADGTACTDDGEFCTGPEECQSGACQSAGNPCAVPADCDEVNDVCANCGNGSVEGGEDCDPAAPQSDTCCDPATCLWTAAGLADPQDSCSGAPECQTDVCDGSGGCTTADETDGTTCTSDGEFCTGVEICQSGSCVSPGDPCPGPDGDDDCSETCDETADDCVGNDPDASACDDGLYCNGADTCDASGGCSVHAGNPCTGPDGDLDCAESCDETAGDCGANDPDGSACADDGDDCTDDECITGTCMHPCAPAACMDGTWCACSETCDRSDPVDTGCTAPLICSSACDQCVTAACDTISCSDVQDCIDSGLCMELADDCVTVACVGGSPPVPEQEQVANSEDSFDGGEVLNGWAQDSNTRYNNDVAYRIRSSSGGIFEGSFTTSSTTDPTFYVWARVMGTNDNDGRDVQFHMDGSPANYWDDPESSGSFWMTWVLVYTGSLSAGSHVLGVECSADRNTDRCYFDGFIATTNATLDPNADDPNWGDDPADYNDAAKDFYIPEQPGSGGTCSDIEPETAGTACDDGLDCNENEVCDAAGSCGGGNAVDCDDSVDCTDDDCVEGTGCQNTPNDSLCDDGNVCTINTCDAVLGCQSADNDGVPCTVDTCTSTCLGGLCDGCESLVDPDSPVYATSTCLTEGTGALAVLSVDLQERDGTPITGATVTIEADDVAVTWTGPVVESATVPGTYYRIMEPAAAAVGSTVVTFTGDAGGVEVLNNTVTVGFAAPVQAPRGGTGGCSPASANLRIQVVESETGTPIENAYVMVGTAEAAVYEDNFEDVLAGNSPDLSNTGQTDANGYIEFLDHGGALSGPVMVTAGIAGRNYFSVVDVDASDLVLPLTLLSVPQTTSTISGSLINFNDLANDGFLDGSMVFGNLSLETMLRFNLNALMAATECWLACSVPLMGDQYAPIPTNLYVPAQQETYIFDIDINEHTYATVPIPDGTTNLLGLSGKLPWDAVVDMLLNGTGTLSDLVGMMVPTEIGVIRNKAISGDENNVDIPLDYDLLPNVDFTIDNNPTASDVLCTTFGDWNGTNGVGPLFPMGMQIAAYDSGFPTIIQVSSIDDTSDFAGISYLAGAVALYMDGSRAGIPAGTADGISSVLDRSLTSFDGDGGSMTFDDFFSISPLTEARPDFSFSDVSNANSPLLHYTEHRLDRVLSVTYVPDPTDCPDSITDDIGRENYWTILTAPTATGFTLPTLPAGWPRQADGGLMDPAGTPQEDRLNWAFAAYHLGLASSFDFNLFEFADFMDTVTHSSFNNRDF